MATLQEIYNNLPSESLGKLYILNKFRSICKDESIWNSFTFAIKNKNLDLIVDILFNLPYLLLTEWHIKSFI